MLAPLRRTASKALQRLGLKNRPFSLPAHLARNHRDIQPEKLNAVERSIRANYHKGWRAEDKYTPAGYQMDLADHLKHRLEDDRTRIIPWLDDVRPLKNARILEIGCGTGSSTVALAEQGAIITAVDVDDDSLTVAADRCEAYGLRAEFKAVNGQQIAATFAPGSFDFIIFFACLEHMTIAERLESLRQGWDLLPPSGLMVIVETPNRLWFRDEHTAMLPFFHWLPNELAFKYSRFSDRENFRENYRDYDPTSKQHFLRRGRGMSFHEIDLAIAPIRTLQIVSSLAQYGKKPRFISEDGRKFKSAMCQLFPALHDGLFDEYLDLIIRRN